ncbi:hypothetical protein [Listeria ivanovii]|uniref:hypothetical protein n=1 Tax=Listeria ivanovii TaxID=1638 RepID=UPI0005127B60|nr:hypothetical protein [Listeria ivanovii]AIS62951.1 membrane protein [Listeria ivanovii subsp. londoniensis]MBK1985334.1 hypothetical protein [Listeria ivanovii subsp. londoniensis]MBK1996696.1 hypothetical protein [Listeria ivanovii subsp. londoniensis]
MLKAHWKLEWNARRYWFLATFSGWLICLLAGVIYKLVKGYSVQLVIESGSSVATFTSGDEFLSSLFSIIGGSWLIIWVLIFVAAPSIGVYDEKRYLFFQTETPIWKILVNKLIVALVEVTILTAGFLFFTLLLAAIGNAELSFLIVLKIIGETFIGSWLVTMSFVCIVIVATALSMIPINGYRFGFIAAIIYFLLINGAQTHIGSSWLPDLGPEIQFNYSIGLEFQFSILVFIFNLLFGVFLLFIATKILNKSADLQ